VTVSPWLGVAAALLVLVPSRALAQGEIDQMREEARMRIGGLYVSPSLELREFGLDSNVFNESGEQSPDFTATLVPGATIGLPIARRALILGRVDSNFVYYHRFASQRSIDPNVSLRATAYLNRISVWIEGSYQNSRQRINQEIDARARRLATQGQAGIDVQATPRITVTISGGANRSDYADDQVYRDVGLRQALAGNARSFNSSIRYQWTPLTSFHLQADTRAERFQFATFKDVDRFHVSPGVEFRPRALISGSAYVGISRLRPLDPTVQRYTGPAVKLSLSYAHQSATSVTVTMDRDAQVSYQANAPYFIGSLLGASVRRQLIGSFDATAGVQRHRYSYLARRSAVAVPQRVDTTHNLSADVGYRFGTGGRIGLGVSYWSRSSNLVSDVEYAGVRIGTTLNYGF
jgi:hypothetical protein